jgi:hypothetical protein
LAFSLTLPTGFGEHDRYCWLIVALFAAIHFLIAGVGPLLFTTPVFLLPILFCKNKGD